MERRDPAPALALGRSGLRAERPHQRRGLAVRHHDLRGHAAPEALPGHAHPRRSGPERGARLSRARRRRRLLRRRAPARELADGQDVPPGRRRRRARRLAVRRRLVRRRRRRPQHVRPDAGPDHPHRAAEHALHGARSSTSRRRPAPRARCDSPNLATRYLAYEKLHAMGRGAENVLAAMYRGTDARERARALWLLARIPGRGARYLDAASRDADPNIRIVALRATRRIGGDVIPIAARLVTDPAPEVRREVAIALRHEQSPRAAALWADLAAQHDGKRPLVSRGARRLRRPAVGSLLRRVARPGRRRLEHAGRPRHRLARPLGARAAAAREARDAIRRRRSPSDCATSARSTSIRPRSASASLLAILATPAGARAELTPVILEPARREEPRRATRTCRPRCSARSPSVARHDAVRRARGAVRRTRGARRARSSRARQAERDGGHRSGATRASRGAVRRSFAQIVARERRRAARRALVVLGRNYTPASTRSSPALALDSTRALDLRRVGRAVDGHRLQRHGSGCSPSRARADLARPLKPAAARRSSPRGRSSATPPRSILAPPPSTTLDGKTLPPLMTLAARTRRRGGGTRRVPAHLRRVPRRRGHGHRLRTRAHRDRRQAAEERTVLAILDPSAGIGFGYEGWTVRTKRRPAARRHDLERDGRRGGDEAHRRDPAPRAEEHHRRTEAHGRVAHAAGARAHDDRGGLDEPRRVPLDAAHARDERT